MKTRLFGVLVISAILLSFFTPAGAEGSDFNQTEYKTIHFDRYGFPYSIDIPVDWVTSSQMMEDRGHMDYVCLEEDKYYEIQIECDDWWAVTTDKYKERYGIEKREDMSLAANEALCEYYSGDGGSGEISWLQDINGMRFAISEYDSQREIDGLGNVSLHCFSCDTMHLGNFFNIWIDISNYNDADKDIYTHIINSFVYKGEEQALVKKDDRRKVSFEDNGYVVEMEIPDYLVESTTTDANQLLANGSWKSTRVTISASGGDFWLLMSDADKEMFGVTTREEFKASYEEQAFLDTLLTICENSLDLDWTSVKIGDVVYITGVSEDSSTNVETGHLADIRGGLYDVYYATIYNGGLTRIHFSYIGPEPDDAETILSIMETVSYSYTGTD